MLLAPHTPPNPSSQLRMDVSWSDGIATVAAHGRLDAAAAPELTARLSEIIEVVRPRRLVVDLADVPYVGRSGALALIAASAELPGPSAQLVIRAIPSAALRFFQVAAVAVPPPAIV
ncbi:MAG TPA: STAS domain-containing protein [Streptosporangiaceae bacterium]|nr:STAS domain-containing protein [Streptosporangiaceae bacterium]